MSNIFQKIEADFETGFKDAETFLVGEFEVLKGEIAPAVVKAITAVQTAEASGVVPAIAAALSPLTKGLSVTINNYIEANLPKALAIAIGLQGFPDSPTQADITNLGQEILTAWGGPSLAAKGTIPTNLAGQVYNLIQTAIAGNAGTAQAGTLTLGQIIVLVEKAFEELTADQTAAATN